MGRPGGKGSGQLTQTTQGESWGGWFFPAGSAALVARVGRAKLAGIPPPPQLCGPRGLGGCAVGARGQVYRGP